MNTAQRIAALRDEKHLSQAELAKALHIAASTVGMWETGKRMPSPDLIKQLAKLFDVSSDYILGITDKRHYYSLSPKDEKSIDEELEEMINGLSDKSAISFFKNEAELSEHDKELLVASLRTSLALAKEMSKKSFTPKKYRGSESED